MAREIREVGLRRPIDPRQLLEARINTRCRQLSPSNVLSRNGLAIEKAVAFLTRFAVEQQVKECLYIGDVDEAGLAIPHRLNAAVSRASTSSIGIKPWIPAYSRMLREAEVQKSFEPPADGWLPSALNAHAQAWLAAGRRVAQESCGWKQIRELIRLS